MNAVQEKILEIFKVVKDICDRNGIEYFGISGTCIGAVRHNGFIPWDDDIDIAIPIEQYDRFLDIARKELPEHMSLYTCHEQPHYRNVIAKVCDDRTALIEERHIGYKDALNGVFVDVMPISGLPSNPMKRKIFIMKLNIWLSLNEVLTFGHDQFAHKGALRNYGYWIMKPLIRHHHWSYYREKVMDLMRKYPFKGSEWTACTWWWIAPNVIFPTEYFTELIDIPFEDTTIKCPKRYDEYLTHQFGDYMQLPPVEKRVGGHALIADLEHSWKEYAERDDWEIMLRKKLGMETPKNRK